MEVTLDVPIMMLVFLFVVSIVAAIVGAKCIQQACIRDTEHKACGGYAAGGVVALLTTLILGGHFIWLLNQVVCKLGKSL